MAATWLHLARQTGAHTGSEENSVLDVANLVGHPEEAIREGVPLLAELQRTRRTGLAFGEEDR